MISHSVYANMATISEIRKSLGMGSLLTAGRIDLKVELDVFAEGGLGGNHPDRSTKAKG